MSERTFTEDEVRRLLWIIGYVTPLNGLMKTYDTLAELLTDPDRNFKTDAHLIRIARGVWCDAGSYGVGSLHDPDCDLGTKGQERLNRLIAIEEDIIQSGEDLPE